MIALSIIVPVYNAARFILDFAAYITDHLNTNIEVVFINDGSTDNSWELLQQVSKTLPNKQILNKTNGGAASARNLGIQHAQGDYLLFVDIDDTFELPLIAEKIKWVREQELDLFVYRYNYIKQDGSVNNLTSKHPVTYHKVDTGLFFLQQGYQPSSICVFIVNKSFITKHKLYFVEGITHEDVEVSLRYMLAAEKVYFSEAIWYHYHQHSGSVTNQTTTEKKVQYLIDEVRVASLMKAQEKLFSNNKPAVRVIKKNYNSVVWNLLYSLYQQPDLLTLPHILSIIHRLEVQELYPIKGPLKTAFQNISTVFMNRKWLLLLLYKKRSPSTG